MSTQEPVNQAFKGCIIGVALGTIAWSAVIGACGLVWGWW